MKRRLFTQAALGAAAATCAGLARAQSWPAKPVTCVVGYAPGGGVDFVMRSVAPALSARLGQPFVIDNRPGASGIIAARLVASAQPDGYTLFGSDGGALVLNSALYNSLPYEPRDFLPISQLIRVPMLVVAHPGVPANNLKELVELSKRQPLSYASAGKGSYHHLAMEVLKMRAGFQAQDVTYKGAGPAAQDVVAGQVPIMPLDCIVALPHLRAGKLKALAALAAQRLPALPQVPTAAEQGVTEADSSAWVGLAAPKGTPRDLVARLHRELTAVVAMPDVHQRFTGMGMEPVANTPEEFAAVIDAEIRRYHPLVKSLDLRLN